MSEEVNDIEEKQELEQDEQEEYFTEEQSDAIRNIVNKFVKKISKLWIIVVVYFVFMIALSILRSHRYYELKWLRYTMLGINIALFALVVFASVKAIIDYKKFKKEMEDVDNLEIDKQN